MLHQNARKVIALVEKVFRGQKNLEPVQMDGATYKPDYVLIPKDQEHLYLQSTVLPRERKIMPRTTEFPPLYLQMLLRQMKSKDVVEHEQLKLPIAYNISKMDIKGYRIAEEGETPTVKFEYGIKKDSVFYPKTETSSPS